jgi:hypothetical protein
MTACAIHTLTNVLKCHHSDLGVAPKTKKKEKVGHGVTTGNDMGNNQRTAAGRFLALVNAKKSTLILHLLYFTDKIGKQWYSAGLPQ